MKIATRKQGRATPETMAIRATLRKAKRDLPEQVHMFKGCEVCDYTDGSVRIAVIDCNAVTKDQFDDAAYALVQLAGLAGCLCEYSSRSHRESFVRSDADRGGFGWRKRRSNRSQTRTAIMFFVVRDRIR